MGRKRNEELTDRKEKLLWTVLAIAMLLAGALGLHMSILLNQRMGPSGVTGRVQFVREIPTNTAFDSMKENSET